MCTQAGSKKDTLCDAVQRATHGEKAIKQRPQKAGTNMPWQEPPQFGEAMALHVDDQRDPGVGARLEGLAAVACSYKAPGAGAQWHEQREISETKAHMCELLTKRREGERERGTVTPTPLNQSLPSFSLPNPILYLGIPCALVKLME